ncbi:MAG: glutaminyl-peptide cyclotransferase [Acidobacteriota bacterium]
MQKLSIEIVATYPHDPGAFTQGLLWSDGRLYESTGLYGRSTLRLTVPETGEILERRELDGGYFGEGIAEIDDRLIQLTWKTGIALVWDRERLEIVDQWSYNGEGWGLTYNGEHLILSDGSPRLTFRRPDDFQWVSTLEVTLDGKPLRDLNELEWVDGRIYANLWGKDRLVRIDPTTGAVDAVIEAEGLLTPAESRMVDVLNGVAYDPASKTFWLTGKFWPKMFQVRFVPSD